MPENKSHVVEPEEQQSSMLGSGISDSLMSTDHDSKESTISPKTEYLSLDISSDSGPNRRTFFSKVWEVSERLYLSLVSPGHHQDAGSAESRRNDEVEKLLDMWAKEKEKEVRALLLGLLAITRWSISCSS